MCGTAIYFMRCKKVEVNDENKHYDEKSIALIKFTVAEQDG